MEAVVFDDSPLAEYLEGEGGDYPHGLSSLEPEPSSTSSSPSFAPRGRPTVRSKYRHRLPPPIRLAIPQNNAVAAIHDTCSRAVTSRLGSADNARFLERFRYIIVASQLLNTHSYLGQGHGQSRDPLVIPPNAPQAGVFTLAGVGVTACFAFALAWLIHWTMDAGKSVFGKGHVAAFFLLLVLCSVISYSYMRRQWLQYLRQQSLAEASGFVTTAQNLDNAAAGALTLVQEVELVSRGYRISSPLPPISRIEDQSQTRRCTRLRKCLRICFAGIIPQYSQACAVLKPLTEQLDLEKYYDIYDISDVDFSEAMLGYSETEFEDFESLRVLKILAARFHIIRKVLLCCLLALDADGGKSDFPRWSTAVEEIHKVREVTSEAEDRLSRVLGEEENFPVPATPKLPLTPSRERWRSQLRKLNSLSAGIRGLQAKLHVLREESDKNLNATDDVSELGTSLMIQYESIGIDLKALMQEWEDGKAALASNIDRNERRVSSMSVMSPASSLGGATAVEEGSAADALKILNGEVTCRSSMDFSSSDVEEVFEAIAIPKQRSKLTREERILKMREEREKREAIRERTESNTHMIRELESVIKMRPRGRTTTGGRITSI